nr:MAG TPA: hypothetical protein [Caudoviricetes sp.]
MVLWLDSRSIVYQTLSVFSYQRLVRNHSSYK